MNSDKQNWPDFRKDANDAPRILIIIVTWNKSKYVLQLLNSLAQIDYPKEAIDILVVDNHSNDNTAKAILESYPDVRLIINPENLGGDGGFNTGLKWAFEQPETTYRYYWLLDNDVLVHQRALIELVTVLEENQDAGAAGSTMMQLDCPWRINEMGATLDRRNGMLMLNRHMQEINSWKGKNVEGLLSCNVANILEELGGQSCIESEYVAAASLLVRSDVARKAGLWMDFFIHYDDVEWCLRIAEMGKKIFVSCISFIWHLSAAAKVTPWLLYYDNRNVLYLLKAHGATKTEIRRLIRQIKRRALEYAVIGKKEISQLYVDAVNDFISGRMGKKEIQLSFGYHSNVDVDKILFDFSIKKIAVSWGLDLAAIGLYQPLQRAALRRNDLQVDFLVSGDRNRNEPFPGVGIEHVPTSRIPRYFRYFRLRKKYDLVFQSEYEPVLPLSLFNAAILFVNHTEHFLIPGQTFFRKLGLAKDVLINPGRHKLYSFFNNIIKKCFFKRLNRNSHLLNSQQDGSEMLFSDVPHDLELINWAGSEWEDYSTWISRHSFVSKSQWEDMRKEAASWGKKPLISIITPTYNPDPHLLECVYSVYTQSYPNWEMCIVDDGSSQKDTIELLKKIYSQDPRIKLHQTFWNEGITQATNRALKMAEGDYVAFLDHDDRLSPDALFRVASAICENPSVDILYSDKDMLSLGNRRFMHMLKPDWSPELLLSYNYAVHLMVYRKRLVEKLGGVRSGFEGSQDYDLLLRASECNPSIIHLPRVLYHWRQHEQSVSMNFDSKEFAWKSGVRVLQETIKRRGLEGDVSEIKNLWRGNYRVRLRPPSSDSWAVVTLENEITKDKYAEEFLKKTREYTEKEFLIILGNHIVPSDENSLEELVSWFQIPEVAIVTGKIVDGQQRILHAGLVHKPDGIPFSVYEQFEEKEAGYLAVTSVVRNVSSPHPFCFAVRRTILNEVHGLCSEYQGPYSIFDLALHLLQKKYRIVYTPFARFSCVQGWRRITDEETDDHAIFRKAWSEWLEKGDPFYNPGLTSKSVDMRLNLDAH